MIASFFDEENLEFIESQILDVPENGYDSTNEFSKKKLFCRVIYVTQQGLPLLCYRYLTRKRSGEGGKREEGSRERGEGREGS